MIDTLFKLCERLSIDYKIGTATVRMEVLMEYIESICGPNDPYTIKWKNILEKSNKEKLKIHEENVAWDDWKDSLLDLDRKTNR